jgi:pimeloyl-ACP methyl ester carboxylesterase
MSAGLSTGHVSANGLEFAYLEAGEGRLALCLHGFPDSAWTWRELLPALADRGFRAVAPWLRGYSPTEIPPDGRYQGAALVADALALHDTMGGDENAVIIGHDWGAYAAYGALAYAPARWRRGVALAVPPLALAAQAILDYDQLRRSWYHFFFQHPLAEEVIAGDDHAFIARLWSDWSPALQLGDLLDHAKEALQGDGRLSAALGYYRALWDPSRHDPALAEMQGALLQPPPQPTLYLHGDQDGCMDAKIGAGADAFLGPGSRHEIVPGAGHFVHLEQAATVINRILDFVDS